MIIKTVLAVALASSALVSAPAAGGSVSGAGRPAGAHAAIGTTAGETGPGVAVGGDPSTRLHPSVAPPRPRYVAGYTPHALENMAERHITKAQVEAVIAGPDPGVYQDNNDTWLVTDGILIVIINKNAWIVTGYGKD